MKPVLIFTVLIATAAPALAQTVVCPYGQTCNGAPRVPFPVINPAQGLSNVLTGPQRQNQPAPQQPIYGGTPIATPPPVMPTTRP
jgi:hypothetical protein